MLDIIVYHFCLFFHPFDAVQVDITLETSLIFAEENPCIPTKSIFIYLGMLNNVIGISLYQISTRDRADLRGS